MKPRDDGKLPTLPLRRRVLLALLAVATAVTVWLLLIYRPGDPKRGVPFAKPVSAAASGVGAKADVLLLAPVASSPQR